MKSKRVLFFVLPLLVMFTACNQKAKRAKDYHDKLMHTVRVVVDSSLEYTDAIESHDRDRIMRAQQQYSSLVNKTIASIHATGNFEGDTSLKFYSLELVGFYRASLDSDFIPFLKTVKSNSFTEEESFVADSLYTVLTTTQNNYWNRFDWAEKKFEKQYGLDKLEK